jgi:four helix bundle protein
MYGLSSQMKRAAVSIASNIAEGYGRLSSGEYRQFLGIVRGSTLELQTQFEIARVLGRGDLKLIDLADNLSQEVSKMLYAMLKKRESLEGAQPPDPEPWTLNPEPWTLSYDRFPTRTSPHQHWPRQR